jgi:hypothetical protein
LWSCGNGGDEEAASPDASAAVDAAANLPMACDGLMATYDLSNASYSGYARPRDAGDPSSPTVYGLTAILDQGPPTDLFEIQLWSGFGAFADAVGPGVIPIQGAETSLNDCGFCALLFGDMAANGTTNTVLVAQSGDFTIDALSLEAGGAFTGSASEVQYNRVDSSGTIPGGCGARITNIAFDVTLDAP